jgi:hypothetical protein
MSHSSIPDLYRRSTMTKPRSIDRACPAATG